LSNVVMHVKKGTSWWLKDQSPDFQRFDWQDSYGAFYARSATNFAARFQRANESSMTPDPQGGASCARWPWAGLRCTFGAKGNVRPR
jgi:hypothetical protein